MVNRPENIEELLSKYFSGNALPEEAMLLHDWSNANEENRLYFESCEKLFFSSVHKTNVKQAWKKIDTQLKTKKTNLFIVWRAAAVFILLFGVGAVIYFLIGRNDVPTEYIASAQPIHAILTDGTDITLSPGSKLTLAGDFGHKKRNLYLKGSAYFSVIHKEESPFVIDVGGIFIKDIGTKFLIQSSTDTDTVHVRVDEGIVLLFDSLHQEVEIKAGASAMYIKSIGKIISTPQTNSHIELSFSNMNLADVIQKLSTDYKVKIEITNPALNNCVITSQFKDEKLETILSVITETLNISYKKTDSGYIISGEHCQQ